MGKKYVLNQNILYALKENGRKCVCDLSKPCICDDMINKGICRCGLFKEVD